MPTLLSMSAGTNEFPVSRTCRQQSSAREKTQVFISYPKFIQNTYAHTPLHTHTYTMICICICFFPPAELSFFVFRLSSPYFPPLVSEFVVFSMFYNWFVHLVCSIFDIIDCIFIYYKQIFYFCNLLQF